MAFGSWLSASFGFLILSLALGFDFGFLALGVSLVSIEGKLMEENQEQLRQTVEKPEKLKEDQRTANENQ